MVADVKRDDQAISFKLGRHIINRNHKNQIITYESDGKRLERLKSRKP